MSSICRNYANCLHSLDDHDNHNGLCLECYLACQEFVKSIQDLLAGRKLATEDGIYLFLHRHGTLEDLARHLGINHMSNFLTKIGSLTTIRQQLQPVQAALICLRCRDIITAQQLVELTVEPKDEEEKIDCKKDDSGEDIEEPILSEVCPIEVIPTEIPPTKEPVSEETSQSQTPILQPEVIEKPVNRAPIAQPECNDQRKARRLIAKIIGDRKLPNKCVDFTSTHLKDCKAAELDTLLEMTTCRYLASHGVIKNCYMAPPERTGRGNHREVWMVPVESIILVCDKHFNLATIPQAVIQLKKMYHGIVIDRNTLRKYVLEEDLCEHSTNLFDELAILVSVLPEVPNRYREIQTRLLKNRGVHKDPPKQDELTPEKIFKLLQEKISYKDVLAYLNGGILPGEKRHGRWISTPEQYKTFLQNATNGVHGIRPEHIPICRECLSKPYSIAAAEQ